MSQPIALLSSSMTHGATPIAGSPDTYVNGQPILRLGDLIYCPIHGHGINPIVTVLPSQTTTDNNPNASVLAIAYCGAMIISGSPNFYIG